MSNFRKLHEAKHKGEVIHSGHFMISSVADDQEESEEMNNSRDSPIDYEHSVLIKHGYDFSHVQMEAKDTYQFGPFPSNQVTIDASLARLFQCMSLAYQGGKVVSPKWKNFKGMKLTVKDKIRLNNAIWRTWHIQYIIQKKKDQSLIQFVTPFEMDHSTHSRPEAVVLEGKYWKRRIETVVAEYQKWRAFYLTKWSHEANTPATKEWTTDLEPMTVQDEHFMNEFTDTLFTSLSQQPFQFPNPREIAQHATNSDMIQPGLLQLQPIMDDFMDFDPFQDLLFSPKKPPTFTDSTSQLPMDVLAESVLENAVVDQTSQRSNSKPAVNPTVKGSSGQLQMSISNSASSSNQDLLPALDATSSNQSKPFQQVFVPTPISPSFNQPQQAFQSDGKIYLVSAIGMPQQVANQGQASNFISHYPTPITRNQIQTGTNAQASKVFPNKTMYSPAQTASSLANFSQNQNPRKAQQSQPGQAVHVVQFESVTPPNSQVTTSPPFMLQRSDHTHELLPTRNDVSIPSNVDSSVHINSSSESSISSVQSPMSTALRKRGYDVESSATSKTTVEQHNFQRPFPSKVPAPFSDVPVKKRSIDETQLTSLQKQQSTRKPSLSDVDMENMVLDQTSYQDNDFSQVESLQKHGTFSTEQKRRLNIKSAFHRLQQLIPGVTSHSNTKISKANMMSKTVQYIKSLQTERNKMNEEIESLKDELDHLQSSITAAQLQLPATGIQLSGARSVKFRENFNAWCQYRTQQDWKFYLFSTIIQPWFDSYQRTVAMSEADDFSRTLFSWIEQHCSLRVLRSNVVQSLQTLSTTTSIMTNPALMQLQIEEQSRRYHKPT